MPIESTDFRTIALALNTGALTRSEAAAMLSAREAYVIGKVEIGLLRQRINARDLAGY